MKINNRVGHLQDWITQVWVKMTGRRYNPTVDSWLVGPIGGVDIIKDKFAFDLASIENLEVKQNVKGSGLFDSFDVLQLTVQEKNLLHPKIIDFYEKTSNYDFEIWSEWRSIFKPFGWLLSSIFSKRLQQLNIPLNPLEAAKGIQSDIIKLIDKSDNKSKWTVWYRKLKSNNNVIYSGVYTTCELPNYPGKFFKVVFPLPNGSATVIMRKEILQNGALRLSSDGKRFGDNGFYFTLTNHNGKYWSRFVRSMHEWITVYVDDESVLRADHNLKFYGIPLINLHYKMKEKQQAHQ